jgi:hypothetical protein
MDAAQWQESRKIYAHIHIEDHPDRGHGGDGRDATRGCFNSPAKWQPAAAEPDPQIVAALREISPARIQQTIEKLAGFYTRQTLSSDVPPIGDKGINAAAVWIQGELQRISSQCGDCLEVRTDQFLQPPGTRIPQPTTITNVYAILRGTDPANAGRMYVVTGHYDSRNSDPTDAAGQAPGANDDASGTAVSLECARVLSKHRFPATIIFLTVAGEEEGLYGSAHFAKMAKAVGWDIEAVLNNDIVGGDRTPGDTLQDPHVVRVFSEGISSTASEEELRKTRSLGGESDGPSRQLARYVEDVAKEYLAAEDFRAMLVFRHDRYLRGGDHFRLTSRDMRRCASPNFARTTIISIRTSARRTASNTAICRNSWTTITPRRWRG